MSKTPETIENRNLPEYKRREQRGERKKPKVYDIHRAREKYREEVRSRIKPTKSSNL